MSNYRVYVCWNNECKMRGAQEVWATLHDAVVQRGIAAGVELIVAGCQGRCDWGPNVTIQPGATKYSGVAAAAARRIVEKHLLHGAVVDELLYGV